MIAAKFHGIEDIRVEDVVIPTVGPSDVLIRTMAAGICTSDLEAYRIGHRKLADYCPEGDGKRTPGHEFAGEVVEVGAEVRGIKSGTRVAIAPNYGCGECRFCRKGIYPLCAGRKTIGLDVDGGFAEYVNIPEQAVRQGVICAFSENLSYEAAALNEPLACAYNGMIRCDIQPGEVVLVAGAGPTGLMHLLLAKAAGAGKVLMAETSKLRRAAATHIGADVVLDPEEPDYPEQVRGETDGRGADVVIVACGVPEAQALAPQLAAVRGRINFFAKVPSDKEPAKLNTNLVYSKELSIHGSYGSRPDYFAITLQWLDSGKVNLLPLISNRFHVGEIAQAYKSALADTLAGKGMKTVIRFGKASRQ